MKRSLLASAIALAFGFSTQALANPTNTLDGSANTVDQNASAQSDQSGSGAMANEFSEAVWQTDSSSSSSENNDLNPCSLSRKSSLTH